MTETEFGRLGAAVVVRHNVEATVLSDLAITAAASRALRRALPPLGLMPEPVQTDQRRIVNQVGDIIREAVDVPTEELPGSRRARLAKYAADETLVSTAVATQAAMVARNASGWTRTLDADPCPKCIDWADGVVRPTSVRMARHHGCACTPTPIFG